MAQLGAGRDIAARAHSLVFAVGFAGQVERPRGYGAGRVFLAFTLPGYGIALLVSPHALWMFGSGDGPSLAALGLPAAVGAAITRLMVRN